MALSLKFYTFIYFVNLQYQILHLEVINTFLFLVPTKFSEVAKNNCLKIHSSKLDSDDNFISPNRKIVYDEDPSHQDLCDYEQEYFYKSISENIDLKSHMEDAYKSLQIALACDEAVKKGKTVFLD